MRKQYRWILITVLIILGCAAAAFLGWEWYDANVDRSGWEDEEGIRYYNDFHGHPLTGWQEIEGSKYYFAADGALQTGWQELDGSRYYFEADGALQTGWLDLPDGRFYFGETGAMHTGWLEQEEGSYYLSETGTMHTGWLEQEAGSYYFSETGTMHTGWLELEEGRYYLSDIGTMHTGWLELEEGRYYLSDIGTMHTGWLELEDGNYYLGEDGTMHTGWLELEEVSYYLSETGTMHTGWLEQGEYRYYFLEDGAMAVGPTEIDGQTCYFTPKGIYVMLVNFEHYIPEGFQPNLVSLSNGFQVDAVCKDALERMLADCVAAGNYYNFNSAYRSLADQWWILNTRTSEYMAKGYSYNEAYAITLTSVAYPGTSEHHLGLAVDILGANAQAWLQEHCWEYGFILRYLSGKSAITGIIHEPWHFRYVGTEVSMDMKDTGLCLEEYLGAYVAEEESTETAE